MRILYFTTILIFTVTASFAANIDVDAIKNPIKADKASVVNGDKLYQEHCAVCHGKKADGKGPSADGFDVEPWGFVEGEIDDLSDGFVFQQIKNGGAWYEMPPFALGLKDEEIWHIINYLRSLSK